MHWADVIASRLKESGGDHRIATGITPSGHIHVGNMREILTGDLVHRACKDSGINSTLYYLADDFDPLRKVYPFLPEHFHEHVGKPLSEIPAPEGEGTYSQYFLRPFLESVGKLGIDAEVLPSSESYRDGKYAQVTAELLDSRERIREILERVSGRQLKKDWFPYNAKCPECGRIDSTRGLEWEKPYVHFRCNCGFEGRADTRTDDGKLPWRLDWPARWYWLGVTCEPFGKDHAASGGSYDTSSEIIRTILNREPPEPVVYEWIQLKGKGAMSSSTGVVVSAVDMLKTTPPEVLRFLVAKNQPSRHIDMDPGMGILNLVDEYDRYEKEYSGEDEGGSPDSTDRRRAFELSMVEGFGDAASRIPQFQVPYRHLVTLVQLADDNEGVRDMALRTGGMDRIDDVSEERLEERIDCVRFWLDRFAPEMVKFRLFDETPMEEIEKLNDRQASALEAMEEDFANIPWNAEDIHNTIYEGSRKRDIGPKVTFKAFYRILLGRERGPRLGFFLSTMKRERVLKMIHEALEKR